MATVDHWDRAVQWMESAEYQLGFDPYDPNREPDTEEATVHALLAIAHLLAARHELQR